MDINNEKNENRLVQNNTELDEKFLFAKDPYTLRVRGGDGGNPNNPKKPTDPVALSRAILHVLACNDYVRVLSVGPTALNITMKAFRLSAQEAESRTNGAVLVARQSEYEAIIADKKTKGICTRIFGIPVKNCL